MLASLALAACSTQPPPRWAEGGAPLVIAPARWDRPGKDPIEIRPDGHVTKGGEPYLYIDRAGRVVDEDNEPVAILLTDGHLAGPNNRLLGFIGGSNASPPDRPTAWLTILNDGSVVFFDDEGDKGPGGVWRGCNGPQQRTCTLVTHLVSMEGYRPPEQGPSIGVGVGVGIGF